ncbi:maleylpyruvate isomerase family mycothiol-dependent enzyme [Mycolicibacterium holsaticum DSM 44478 = JCM 12374]|nr:maleylpyruvate isomerase family mycothiol-dependent enzyme [Mycolicibacterium holsaticum DSM 44478 = JCM 12374]UNC11314.1 maleylpyruvate isomerase family mycothiol-dependent enzyme [Mycolicibacterium holsaticum DSM 44478 = JCM 12374]
MDSATFCPVNTSRPVTILDKSTVLAGLFAVWDDIAALAAGLDDPQWQAPTALPGWTVHDVTAHMVGTESMLRGLPTPETDVDVSTLTHVRNDIGAMNERWVRDMRRISPGQLLEEFRAVTADRREALTALSDDDWNAATMTPAGPDSYGRFMRVRVFDCWMHEHDIRDAVGQPASNEELTGPAADLALDEMSASMGFVVGKLGGAPDGSWVSIELTGPLARTINVAVTGRAQVVDDFGDEQPTSTIRLDGLLFTRLAGGRTPLDHDAVTYGGDVAVGRRIVEHLNYVI